MGSTLLDSLNKAKAAYEADKSNATLKKAYKAAKAALAAAPPAPVEAPAATKKDKKRKEIQTEEQPASKKSKASAVPSAEELEALKQAAKVAKKALKVDKANVQLKAAFDAAEAAFQKGVAAVDAAAASAAAAAAAAATAAAAAAAAAKKKEESDDDDDESSEEEAASVAKPAAAPVKQAAKKDDSDEESSEEEEKKPAAKTPTAAAKKEASKEDSEDDDSEEEEEEEKPEVKKAAPAAVEASKPDNTLAGLKSNKNKKADANVAAAPASGAPSQKIFCKNLAWAIDDDGIRKFFEGCGDITDIFWLTDKETGKFRGSGFVTFDSLESAALAMAKNGQDLLGRPVTLDYATPKPAREGGGGAGARGGPGGAKKSMSSKPMSEKPPGCVGVFVGNLSFDIDDDAIHEFAKDCGEIAKIRWVTNRDTGEFKGCGFIDFNDTASVDKFVAKQGQELLGRQIRIDYAKPRE